jgi:hypothetical protein
MKFKQLKKNDIIMKHINDFNTHINENIITNIKNRIKKFGKNDIEEKEISDTEKEEALRIKREEVRKRREKENKNIVYKRPNRDSREEKIEFPCGYYFLTKELVDRIREKNRGPIGVANHGYAFYCDTPERLEEVKKKYKSGNKYKGETITNTYIGKQQEYYNN